MIDGFTKGASHYSFRGCLWLRDAKKQKELDTQGNKRKPIERRKNDKAKSNIRTSNNRNSSNST